MATGSLFLTAQYRAHLVSHPSRKLVATSTLKELCQRLKRPRKVMFMVKAAIAFLIEQLLAYLEAGDILIDGVNSHFLESERCSQRLQTKKILFVGVGISGGEEGACSGSSIVAGGAKEASPGSLSCKLLQRQGGVLLPLVRQWRLWLVKMVHNGMEYGDIQIICKGYHLLKEAIPLSRCNLFLSSGIVASSAPT